MDKALLCNFITRLNKLEDKEYLLSTIAYWAAPTLKGMKPSSLISFSTKGRNLYMLWDKFKYDTYSSLGLRFFELKSTGGHCLVLFYNPEMLRSSISATKNREFLKTMGYERDLTLEQSLQLLKIRFELMCPHEIGIFLGIPVEDVCGFIENNGRECLFCSYWKVYHKPERARSLFQCYDRAKISVIYSVININIFDKTSVEVS